MRELRVQSARRPIRIFYAFDSRRTVILLIGRHKLEQGRFYREYVRLADSVYGECLLQIRREGLLAPEIGGWYR